MKVLLSAFACAPGHGSEYGVGWGVVQQVARKHEVWVLTTEVSRTPIEQSNESPNLTNVRFIYISLPQNQLLSAWEGWGQGIYYLLWQLKAYRVAKLLHNEVVFDLVHHVTYVNSWIPSWIGSLGVPFIWSAGTRDLTPTSFLETMSWHAKVSEVARGVLMRTMGALTGFITASRASLILTASELSSWKPHLPMKRFPLGALTKMEIGTFRRIQKPKRDGFRIATIGRILGWKGHGLALRAFSRLHGQFPDSEYWIIGEGPEREYLAELANELGCGAGVRFIPWLRRTELFKLLKNIDVLVHPQSP